MRKLTTFIILALVALSCTQAPQKEQGRHADWTEGTVVYELNTRQYTEEGTFAAAAAHLPELKELGVDIVWLMPIYPIGELNRKGSLGSYYAIKDYKAVNPEFGTLADFDAFLAKAHELGLKVILDWVANHTSPDHPWVTEKPADWYYRDSLGHTIVEYDWTDIAKLNYDCPEVADAMQDAMHFWLERGIDGFRCDMAYIVPQAFWTKAIASLREEFKDIYFLAEGEEPWLHDAGFDATYSWELHHMLNDIAQGRANGDSLRTYIQKNDEKFPADAYRLAFTSNHDENSWSGSEFERMGQAWRVMTILCFTLPKSQPLIYTAQQIGWDHRFEFFEKDPVPAAMWNDEGLKEEYGKFYKELTDLYHSHPALRPESPYEFYVDPLVDGEDQSEYISYHRICDTDTVSVLIHLAEPWEYAIQTPENQ